MKSSATRRIDGVLFDNTEFPNDLTALLWLFRYAPVLEKNPLAWTFKGSDADQPWSGSGRFSYAKGIAQMLFPTEFEWHQWSDQIVEKVCNTKGKTVHWVGISGCGTSGKSTGVGLLTFIYWLCAPLDTAGLVASKTIESSKRRIWKEISRFYSAFSDKVGGYKDATIGTSPRPFITPLRGTDRKKDDAHGLYVTALHGKDLEKEIGYIKGFHVRRIIVAADELDSLEDGGQALVDTFTDNLATGTQEACFVALGNDPSLLNALGEMMQREKGKPLTLSDTEWTSYKGVECLRLDAWDSPNIRDNGKWTGLVRQQDIDNILRFKGENSPSVWIQLHGLHPPEGSANTVLSESALIKFHCFEKVAWARNYTSFASLDVAFGGDACIFRTFKKGLDIENKLRIEIGEVINLPIDGSPGALPADYQISDKVMSLCKDRGILPEEFILDSTGVGRGVAANLKVQWSGKVRTCEFGGGCSDLIVSDENPKPAKEEYDRRVTELWFSIREFVRADMIRGLDHTTAVQLCSRTYEDKGTGQGRRISIQKKEDMAKSPDEADALACAIDLLRDKGTSATVQGPAKKPETEASVREWDMEGQKDAYSPYEPAGMGSEHW